jgi:hypothetical protein
MSTIKTQRTRLMKEMELTPSILSSLSSQNITRCIAAIMKTCSIGPFEAAVNPKLEPFMDEGIIKLFGVASNSLVLPLASVTNVADLPGVVKDDLATSAFTVALIPVSKTREEDALIPPQQVVCSIQCWRCVPAEHRHLAIGFIADNAPNHRGYYFCQD